MNGFEMVAVMFGCVCLMVTLITCKVSGDRRSVRIAEATADKIVLHADAVSGEVRTEEVLPAQMGVNQKGEWAKP